MPLGVAVGRVSACQQPDLAPTTTFWGYLGYPRAVIAHYATTYLMLYIIPVIYWPPLIAPLTETKCDFNIIGNIAFQFQSMS
jgi:hypothetical protein